MGLDIPGRQKARLPDGDLAGLPDHGQDRVADLGDPNPHECADILTGRLAEGLPEGLGLGVSVCVLFQAVGDTCEEGLDAEVARNYVDGRAALEVADVVEDLVHIQGIPGP